MVSSSSFLFESDAEGLIVINKKILKFHNFSKVKVVQNNGTKKPSSDINLCFLEWKLSHYKNNLLLFEGRAKKMLIDRLMLNLCAFYVEQTFKGCSYISDNIKSCQVHLFTQSDFRACIFHAFLQIAIESLSIAGQCSSCSLMQLGNETCAPIRKPRTAPWQWRITRNFTADLSNSWCNDTASATEFIAFESKSEWMTWVYVYGKEREASDRHRRVLFCGKKKQLWLQLCEGWIRSHAFQFNLDGWVSISVSTRSLFIQMDWHVTMLWNFIARINVFVCH